MTVYQDNRTCPFFVFSLPLLGGMFYLGEGSSQRAPVHFPQHIDWSNVDLMLGQRRGRWPSIEPTLPLVSWVGWISFKTLHSSFKQEIYPYRFLDSSNDPAQSTAPQIVYCMTLEKIICHSSLYFSNNFQVFFQQRKIWIPKTLCSIKGGLGTFHLILFLYRYKHITV